MTTPNASVLYGKQPPGHRAQGDRPDSPGGDRAAEQANVRR